MQNPGAYDQRIFQRRFEYWLRQYHSPQMIQRASEQRVLRDMITVMRYVQEHKVVGTQSTGNMPLKAVREVTADFVNPPKLDSTIGDHTYRLRSEADVWPLHFLHILAEVGDLIFIERGQRWEVTEYGKTFLKRDALIQLTQLLAVWWYAVNWLVTYSLAGMGEALPDGFSVMTLEHLQRHKAGERVDFEQFADELIAATGLTWSRSELDMGQSYLRHSIEHMVIDVLADFGAVGRETREKSLEELTVQDLSAFEITPLGEVLLASLEIWDPSPAPPKKGGSQRGAGISATPPEGALRVEQIDDEMWTFEYPRLDFGIMDEFHGALDLWRSGYLTEAGEEFRRLSEEYPEFIDARHHLALVLSNAGSAEEARQVWEATVAMGLKALPEGFRMGRDQLPWLILENRPFLRAYHGLGLVYWNQGDVERALDIFENLLVLNPNDNQGVRGLAIDAYFEQGDPENALQICELYLNDMMEQVVYGRALALYQLGRRAEADKALCEAVEWLPLVAEELVKSHHQPPPNFREDLITYGGEDQAYYYWKESGQYWEKTPGALEMVKKCLQKREKS